MEPIPNLYVTDRILKKIILPIVPLSWRPNQVTVVRFILTPVVVVLIAYGFDLAGLILFVLTAFTDALDGAMARVRNQITEWGRIYDPLADKLLVASVFGALIISRAEVLIACDERVAAGCRERVWLIIVLIILEFIIIVAALLKKRRGGQVQANGWGKAKMVCEVLGISFLLLGVALGVSSLGVVVNIFLVLALALGIVSFFTYSN